MCGAVAVDARALRSMSYYTAVTSLTRSEVVRRTVITHGRCGGVCLLSVRGTVINGSVPAGGPRPHFRVPTAAAPFAPDIDRRLSA